MELLEDPFPMSFLIIFPTAELSEHAKINCTIEKDQCTHKIKGTALCGSIEDNNHNKDQT